MKNTRCFAFALLFLAVFTKSSGQSSKIKTAPEKAWIAVETFDKSAVPPAGQEGSSYYLLIDEQENISEQEYYTHYAYKILTSEGVQQMSDLSFSFDPAYEQLTLHALRIHRVGAVIDKLPKDIRTIQREQSMDRFLYDGSLTAVINITDVRVGDIIEYSFTKKGYNPAYSGYVSRKVYFNYTVGF